MMVLEVGGVLVDSLEITLTTLISNSATKTIRKILVDLEEFFGDSKCGCVITSEYSTFGRGEVF
jgi:hypothetical protein